MPQLRQAAALTCAAALLFLGLGLPVAAEPAVLSATAPAAPAAAACPLVVKNGGFEQQGAYWTGNTELIDTLNPFRGSWSAYLGDVTGVTHTVKQQVTLPAKGPLKLFFWWQSDTDEDVPGSDFDYMKVILRTDGAEVTLATLGVDPEWLPTWELASYDISAHAGKTVSIEFSATNDATSPSAFFVDEVSIAGCHTYLPLIRR